MDSKGKQKLHLSAKRKNDIRGTKFSLPKPGKQNRFAGDLLLREDQLLMGAWNTKVKVGKGQVESMFGADIIDNVGLGRTCPRGTTSRSAWAGRTRTWPRLAGRGGARPRRTRRPRRAG